MLICDLSNVVSDAREARVCLAQATANLEAEGAALAPGTLRKGSVDLLRAAAALGDCRAMHRLAAMALVGEVPMRPRKPSRVPANTLSLLLCTTRARPRGVDH